MLREVSAEVEQGQLLLVTGSNGSGKSTLLRCLAGLMAPQRGTIECRVEGHDLDTAERRRAIGYVAPDLEFYPELTTGENLDFTCRLRGVQPGYGRHLLEVVGLPSDRPAAFLSSGMKQRLRWVWALAHKPPILLLDEPLQNLDEVGRHTSLELLAEHLRDGLAVVANPDPLELLHVAKRLDLDG